MMYPDEPKLLGDDAAKQSRLNQLNERHIAPLTEFVLSMRNEMGPDAKISYFDPWDGGTNAEVLFLLEAPGPKAVNSSFISRNNPDETAKNMFEISREAGIDRKRTILWNVVPWYIGTGSKIRPAKSKDLSDSLQYLNRLISLLPKLKLIVLAGKKAQKNKVYINSSRPDLRIICSPHPSPLYVNRLPENRSNLLSIFKQVSHELDNIV